MKDYHGIFFKVCMCVFCCAGSQLQQAGSFYMWHVDSQLQHVGSRFPTRGQTLSPVLGAWSLSHWTTREVTQGTFLKCRTIKLLIKIVRLDSKNTYQNLDIEHSSISKECNYKRICLFEKQTEIRSNLWNNRSKENYHK